MSPFYSLIGQNKGIAANANEGMQNRSARSREQLIAQWHQSIEAEKQRKFQDEQRKKQESAAKKAFWTGKAVDIGTGVAGGAILGGMAAGAGEAGGAVAGESGVMGLNETLGAGAGASPIAATAAPAFKPFAGGSVAKGALLGGALGGIGGVGGQNYLGTAIGMPGQNYAREMGAYNTQNDNAMGWTNLGINQARQTSNDVWRQKQYDETQAHNLEIETDRARRTDAYSDWMKRQTPAEKPPKSTLKMQIGADGGSTLSGHPDEVTDWRSRNPSAIGSAPGGSGAGADPVTDTVSRIEYMLQNNPNATDDDVIGFTKGLTEEQRRRVMQTLLSPSQR